MYSLWWSNHIALEHVSRVAENVACCVWKHCKIEVSTCYDDLKYEKITLTYTQS